ncbi:MAG: aminoglycoside phosphotransferase, partial [Sulfurovum sp.]|nr:aminoglycoside phosphotransferase [Sulfurovum sp.]
MQGELKVWLESIGIKSPKLSAMHGDASGRRYYRLEEPKSIVMDSSDMKESVSVFVAVNERLVSAKVRTADIKAYDLEKGFMLLEDIGTTHLFDKVEAGNASAYYEKAIKTLAQVQETSSEGLEPYDADFLLSEMNLM